MTYQTENAETALHNAGSDLWYNGLCVDWQDFLVKQVTDCATQYAMPLEKAALAVFRVYQNILLADPAIKDANPWQLDGAFPTAA